jgi:hypothetical protein
MVTIYKAAIQNSFVQLHRYIIYFIWAFRQATKHGLNAKNHGLLQFFRDVYRFQEEHRYIFNL